MKTTKCDWCGEEINSEHDSREPEACSDRECQRKVARLYREMQEDREEKAREDNYERYA